MSSVTRRMGRSGSGLRRRVLNVLIAFAMVATNLIAAALPALAAPPVAVDDSATVPYETATIIDVLANDSDPDGDPLIVNGIGPASNGLTSSNTTHVTYTPNPGYVGPDSFTYIISDGNGGSDSATVFVTVSPPSSTISGTCTSGSLASAWNPTMNGSTSGPKNGDRLYKGAPWLRAGCGSSKVILM